MNFEERYRAISAQDARFDGMFFTAVKTTGIYCKPSCPARTPAMRNVEFFPSSAAAVEAGYRACKRCLPATVPGQPSWHLTSALANRALRLISDGVLTRHGVAGLAAQLGYSSRQLNRILHAELGASAQALDRVTRAQTARALLTSSTMPIADVAFASGFNSIRAFNEAILHIFSLTPSEVRASARNGRPHQSNDVRQPDSSTTETIEQGLRLSLRLPFRRPYDTGIFHYFGLRSVNSVEATRIGSTPEDTWYARSFRLPHGVAVVTIHAPLESNSLKQSSATLQADVVLTDLNDLPALLARLRRLFDLDADPQATDQALAAAFPGGALANSIEHHPGIRVPGAVDPTEILLRAMVGQQITVAAARTQLNALANLGEELPPALQVRASAAPKPSVGPAISNEHTPSVETKIRVEERVSDRDPGTKATPPSEVHRLFPRAAAIAEHGRAYLRGPARRTDAIIAVMSDIASGELSFGLADTTQSMEDKLTNYSGIGPWTARYCAFRLLGDADILLDSDVAVRKGLNRADLSPADTKALAPWRSYAMMHLWRLSSAPPTSPAPEHKKA